MSSCGRPPFTMTLVTLRPQLFVSNEGMCSTVHCSSSSSWTFSTLEDFLHCVWGSDVVSCWIIRTFQKPKRPSRSPRASRSEVEAKLFVCTVHIKLIFLSLILDYCYTCVYPSRRLLHAGRRTFNVISTWVSRYKLIAVRLCETIIGIHECLPSAKEWAGLQLYRYLCWLSLKVVSDACMGMGNDLTCVYWPVFEWSEIIDLLSFNAHFLT